VQNNSTAFLAVNLAYFFTNRNEKVGILFDTDFVHGLKKYALLSLSNDSRMNYDIEVLNRMLAIVGEHIKSLIGSAKTNDEKIAIHKKAQSLYKIFDEITQKIDKINGGENAD